VVVIPLVFLSLRPWQDGGVGFLATLKDPRVQSALGLSFGMALAAALVNIVVGLILALALTRYQFWGRQALDTLIDLPFIMPTAVAGIALSSLYAPSGLMGGLLEPLGIRLAFGPAGIFIALLFVGLPFVVRTVQPLLLEAQTELEESATTLGANGLERLIRVIIPGLMPALLTGFSLSFARGVGEYGSVIFLAGNLPYISEIAPLLIIIKLEEYDYTGAASLALVMLFISLIIILCINGLQKLLPQAAIREGQ